jgi:hypothetical protein
MNPSNLPNARPNREELAALLYQELIRLRDALVLLSINLKDWQIEADQNGKLASQKMVTDTLNRCRLQRPSDGGSSESSRSTAAGDQIS